jgi:hypothetical protein
MHVARIDQFTRELRGTFSALRAGVKCLLLVALSFAATAAFCPEAKAQSFGDPNDSFFYGAARYGRVSHRFGRALTHPTGKVDPRIDPRLCRAASLADERANAQSKGWCWRYVKQALVAAGAVNSYPKTNYAVQAGDELMQRYGFQRLSMRDPYAAPVGAVLVYGGHGAGHVELRTRNGFVSDYRSRNACFYRLVAVYAKLSS